MAWEVVVVATCCPCLQRRHFEKRVFGLENLGPSRRLIGVGIHTTWAIRGSCPPIAGHDYREPGKVPAGKKGMLWSMTYRGEGRTLTDAEVDAAHEALVARLLTALRAERR